MHVLFVHGAGSEGYKADRLLAESLQQSLGPEFKVRYPQMPTPDRPDYAAWKAAIAAHIADIGAPIVLVGHSFGGSVLLRSLVDTPISARIAAVVMLAAPMWGTDPDWQYDVMVLPADGTLPDGVPLLLYHSRDDEEVPFAHLGQYAERFPRAVTRVLDGRGHQFGNDLADVARDIQQITARPR